MSEINPPGWNPGSTEGTDACRRNFLKREQSFLLHAVIHAAALVCILISLAAPRPLHAARARGIDVSTYQGSSVNWTNVFNSGRTFAWARATEGHGYSDPTFANNVIRAKAAGVIIGAYHYSRPDLNFGPAGAVVEANHFWNAVRPHMSTNTCLMPVCDIERYPNDTFTYTRTTLSQWVNAWCSNVVVLAAADGLAVKPFVYTYISYANNWLNSSVTNWPLWMANNYAGQNSETGGPSSLGPWSNWVFWQYGQDPVSGVSGDCDVNVFNGTMAQISPYVIGGLGESAQLVSARVPGVLTTNQPFIATITMKNNGGTLWTNSVTTPYRLGSQSPANSFNWGLNRISLPTAPVSYGQNVTFAINTFAPSVPGNYIFSWRMVRDINNWFGDTYSTVIQVGTPVFANYEAGLNALPASAPDPTSASGGNWWLSNVTAGAESSFISTGLSPDPQSAAHNAWRVLDNTNASGKLIFFRREPNPEQVTNSQWAGFKMSSLLRIADPVATNAGTMSVYFSFGVTNFNRRFLLYLDVDTNGFLTAIPQAIATNAVIVTDDPDAALAYHNYEIIFDPATRTATYLADGNVLLSNLPPITAPNASTHGAVWGVGSSGGRGDGYFNQVRCEIYDNTPTVVTTNPTSVVLPLDATHTFTAAYAGCATNLQWFKNNLAIPGANDHALTLTNITTNDAAAYKLGIADPQTGTTVFTMTATLTVQPTISIGQSSGNVTITFTGTLQASDSVTGPFTNLVPAPTTPLTLTNPSGGGIFYRSRN